MSAPQRLRLIYWAVQVTGWSLCMGMLVWWNYQNDSIAGDAMTVFFKEVIIAILASHALRSLIRRRQWLRSDIGSLLPRLALGAVVIGTSALVLQLVLHVATTGSLSGVQDADPADLFSKLLSWTLLLVVWAMGYVLFHYFSRHRREEIRILRLETAKRENQLGNLRRQLNPHFMFNALNGIRALVDEDPARAKHAITQLSAILRNSMMTVKRETVPLGEELDIVKAYLDLEAMRFEERLRVHYEVEPGLEREPVPPMMLQTLAENAVRHGIAHLTEGGQVAILAEKKGESLFLTVRNSGRLRARSSNGTGIGLSNTRQRLRLLYGDRSALRIHEENGLVITEVEIPINMPVATNRPPLAERLRPARNRAGDENRTHP